MMDEDRKTRPEIPESKRAAVCECRCGYTCGRQCGLDLFGPDGCVARHYRLDCGHVWDGPEERGENWSSATCSKCKAVQMLHDMEAGP